MEYKIGLVLSGGGARGIAHLGILKALEEFGIKPSITGKGISRIVPFLKQGAGVVTTRGHIHWVVTEYGAVNLFGMNMEQRAKELIKLAHPQFREKLEKEAYERFK